jgi:hypothetical protein
MTSLEGSSYTSVEAGPTVPNNSIRMLRNGEGGDGDEASSGVADDKLIDRP